MTLAPARALAAYGDDPKVSAALVPLVERKQDLFRSVAIEALGDCRATHAVDAIDRVAHVDGPLRADAALALEKVGDRRSLATLAVGTVAMRNMSLLMSVLEPRTDLDDAVFLGRVRHAGRGLRGGAVRRRGAARVLAGGGRLGHPTRGRPPDPEAGILGSQAGSRGPARGGARAERARPDPQV